MREQSEECAMEKRRGGIVKLVGLAAKQRQGESMCLSNSREDLVLVGGKHSGGILAGHRLSACILARACVPVLTRACVRAGERGRSRGGWALGALGKDLTPELPELPAGERRLGGPAPGLSRSVVVSGCRVAWGTELQQRRSAESRRGGVRNSFCRPAAPAELHFATGERRVAARAHLRRPTALKRRARRRYDLAVDLAVCRE